MAILPLVLVPVLLLGAAGLGYAALAFTDPRRAKRKAEKAAAVGDLFDTTHHHA